MPIMTVQGPIDAGSVHRILPHEHLLLDLTNQYRAFSEASRSSWSHQKVSLQNRGVLARNPLALRDNLLLDDVETAERELLELKKAGGDLLVDATSIGIGRDPLALAALSRATGVPIVVGCGYYYHDTHPQEMGKRTVEQLAEELIGDVQSGIDGTGIRAGVIGEIGISEVMHPDEAKLLAAVARAQAATGAGVLVHIFPWPAKGYPLGLDALEILRKNGADLKKVAINHVDVSIDINLDYITEIVRAGAYAEFDNFGHEFYVDKSSRKFIPGPFATDVQRIRAIMEIVKKGFIDRILVSSDVCHKTLLHAFGGWGYDHVFTNVVPMFLEFGLTREQIQVLTGDNPRAFLDIPGK
jgi:phosphotriesterase-related protein